MSIKLMTMALVAGVAASLAACSSDPGTPTTRPSMAGSSGGSTGSGGASSGGSNLGEGGAGIAGSGITAGTGGLDTGGSAGSGGSSGTTSAISCKAAGTEIALPIIVDSNFIPSGYFAGPEFPDDVDTNPNVTGIVEAACETRPDNEAGHVGNCHKWTFQAKKLSAGDAMNPAGAWGGVFWQAPANNWGMSPGIKAAAGATKVKFRAWSEAGGEIVSFSAGGITSVTCNDDIQLGTAGATAVTLTATPTDYEVDLKGQTYANGIIGGLSWSAAADSVDTVLTFYVDDIQWVAE